MPNPLTQLECRGLGEGHHQERLDQDVLFDHEAEHKLGEREGLARACARLHQLTGAVERKRHHIEIWLMPLPGHSAFPHVVCGDEPGVGQCAERQPVRDDALWRVALQLQSLQDLHAPAAASFGSSCFSLSPTSFPDTTFHA